MPALLAALNGESAQAKRTRHGGRRMAVAKADGKQKETRSPAAREDPPPRRDNAPFVQMLLEALPAPGSVWPRDSREKWVTAALAAFELHYKDKDGDA